MFLLLALIPVTHKIFFTETFQELSTNPSCPNSKDPLGYDWSLSPEAQEDYRLKERPERGPYYK